MLYARVVKERDRMWDNTRVRDNEVIWKESNCCLLGVYKYVGQMRSAPNLSITIR